MIEVVPAVLVIVLCAEIQTTQRIPIRPESDTRRGGVVQVLGDLLLPVQLDVSHFPDSDAETAIQRELG